MSNHLLELQVTINNEPLSIRVPHSETLLDLLRKRLQLTGAKDGCDSGECGACTVLLNGQPVYACSLLAAQAHTQHITTIEGIQDDHEGLHPVQRAFIKCDAVQCGYCTPGMILSTIALLQDDPSPNAEAVQQVLESHVCSCGVYNQWQKAISYASKDLEQPNAS